MTRTVPNRQWPGIDQRDGSVIWPRNDQEAQAAGLVKIAKVSDGSDVRYCFPPDAREIIAGGEYEAVAWA